MSQSSSEYVRLARDAKVRAQGRSEGMRDLLLALESTYTVMARVQEALEQQIPYHSPTSA